MTDRFDVIDLGVDAVIFRVRRPWPVKLPDLRNRGQQRHGNIPHGTMLA